MRQESWNNRAKMMALNNEHALQLEHEIQCQTTMRTFNAISCIILF